MSEYSPAGFQVTSLTAVTLAFPPWRSPRDGLRRRRVSRERAGRLGAGGARVARSPRRAPVRGDAGIAVDGRGGPPAARPPGARARGGPGGHRLPRRRAPRPGRDADLLPCVGGGARRSARAGG